MNRTISALAIAGMLGLAMQAVADDTSTNTSAGQTSPTPAQKQFMKDCMAKAKAANNGTSEQDMKKACKDQMKSSMGNPAEPVTPAH